MIKKKPITTEMAIYKAETLCSRAEYSEYEITKKLRGWGVAASKAETIVEQLVDDGFIDDLRFARAFVNDKAEFARWGVRKIYMSLKAKGIDHDTIKEAMEEVDDEVYERNMIELVKAKGATIDNPRSYDGKTKILRFMMSRGFEADSVMKILNDAELWEE